MFHFSSNIQQVRRSRHLHSRIHSLKKGQRFQAHFWRGGFLCFIGGGGAVFFLNCLENPHCKEQATYFSPTARRSKAFCFCHWNKDTLKTKIKRENSGVAPPEPRWKTPGQKHADVIQLLAFPCSFQASNLRTQKQNDKHCSNYYFHLQSVVRTTYPSNQNRTRNIPHGQRRLQESQLQPLSQGSTPPNERLLQSAVLL